MATSRRRGGERRLRLVQPLWFERDTQTPARQLAGAEAERTRLLAMATGEHALPHELAMRVAQLNSELAQLTSAG